MHPDHPILSPFRDVAFGHIPQLAHAGRGLTFPAAPIIVPVGTIAYGLRHIEIKHAAKISHFYRGLSVLDYLVKVTGSYHRIYVQRDGSLWLIKFNGVVKSAVVVQHTWLDGPCYKVVTAYPLVRLPNFGRRGAELLHCVR